MSLYSCAYIHLLEKGMRIMTLKAVIFDLGGTLIEYPNPSDTLKRLHEAAPIVGLDEKILKSVAEKYFEARNASFDNLKEATFAEALDQALFEAKIDMSSENRYETLKKIYHMFFGGPAQIIKGASELLWFLKRQNLKVGLISNTPWCGDFHSEDLSKFGILHGFSRLMWSSEENIRKPHKDLFNRMLESLGVSSDQAIYVGDNFSRDVVGPNSIGMKAIWVSTKSIPEGQTFNGWQVPDLAGVKKVIESIMKDDKKLSPLATRVHVAAANTDIRKAREMLHKAQDKLLNIQLNLCRHLNRSGNREVDGFETCTDCEMIV